MRQFLRISLISLLLWMPALAQEITLQGTTGSPRRFQRADLEKLPQRQLEVEGRTFRGADLYEVLRLVDAPSGKDMRGFAVRTVAVVSGRDGYQAAFSLAELDNALSERSTLLIWNPEGDGDFRLVVPGDRLRSRWVRMIEKIRLQRVDQP